MTRRPGTSLPAGAFLQPDDFPCLGINPVDHSKPPATVHYEETCFCQPLPGVLDLLLLEDGTIVEAAIGNVRVSESDVAVDCLAPLCFRINQDGEVNCEVCIGLEIRIVQRARDRRRAFAQLATLGSKRIDFSSRLIRGCTEAAEAPILSTSAVKSGGSQRASLRACKARWISSGDSPRPRKEAPSRKSQSFRSPSPIVPSA